MKELNLIKWCLVEFARRSKLADTMICYANHENRLNWSDVLPKMQELNFTGNAMQLRLEFDRIAKRYDLFNLFKIIDPN